MILASFAVGYKVNNKRMKRCNTKIVLPADGKMGDRADYNFKDFLTLALYGSLVKRLNDRF